MPTLEELIAARDRAYDLFCKCDPDANIPPDIAAACNAAEDNLRELCPHLRWIRVGPRSALTSTLQCECCGLAMPVSRWSLVLDKPREGLAAGDRVLVAGEGDDVFEILEVQGQYAALVRAADEYPIGWKSLTSCRRWIGAAQ